MIQNLQLYNSLTRKKEKFEPINPPNVGMYTCGPTVYSYPTIGNYRTYVTADILYRVLGMNAYKVKYVMNLTDVGHLTGDNEGDADTGQDRLEKAAQKEGKNAWDIAKFYSEDFKSSFKKLNMIKPEVLAPATEHIEEQIELIKKLEENGLTYKISDGIYFDTVAFEQTSGKKYGELSTLDQIKEGARVEANPEKKNPRDFALWKFSPSDGKKRDMEWESPWGVGFPGWHIECSAMSMKYLGESFDIHTGGEDLRSTHHPNEIAQSEGASHKHFVNYWVHGGFLKVDGGRMGKSLGNAYTLADVEEKGYDLMALRYFYLGGHYRDQINFTWESLESVQNALKNIRKTLSSLLESDGAVRTELSDEKLKKIDNFNEAFRNALNDDLNTPKALAVMWEMLKSNIPSPDKVDMLYSFDEVFGLGLRETSMSKEVLEIPNDVNELVEKRNTLRAEGKYEESDFVRNQIEEMGYSVKDTPDGKTVVELKHK